MLIDRDEDATFFVPEVYSIRGDRDKTLQWLDRAWNNRDSGVALLLYDPFILTMRDKVQCRHKGTHRVLHHDHSQLAGAFVDRQFGHCRG